MYKETHLESSRTSGGVSLQKPQKSFIVDARLGSEYVPCIGFTIEKVYRMSIFI